MGYAGTVIKRAHGLVWNQGAPFMLTAHVPESAGSFCTLRYGHPLGALEGFLEEMGS